MKFSRWIFWWIMPMVVVSSHGSVPLNTTRSLAEILRKYPRRAGVNRGRRSASAAVFCKKDDMEAEPKKCCVKCPPGYYCDRTSDQCGSHSCRCLRCGQGSYTDKENQLPKCFACSFCDEHVGQMSVKHCGRDQKTECGCQDGYFVFDPSPASFQCHPCSECPDRSVLTACSVTNDTQCGPCKFDFYEDHQHSCQPCTQSDFKKPGCQHRSTTPQTPAVHIQDSHVLVISICLVVLLILVSLLCCFLQLCSSCKWAILHWIRMEAPKQSYPFQSVRNVPQGKTNAALSDPYCENHKELLTVESRTAQQKMRQSQVAATEITVNSGACSSDVTLLNDTGPKTLIVDLSAAAETWPASVLYTIIREVPARRWKEFLRLLSVPDGQMERVEMEAGPCYLEQQYQMLRLWSQRGGATLEAVYSALHSMNLSGCAQELQEKLQQLQQQVA